MDIIEATRLYETWIGEHVALIAAHVDIKHRKMRESAFVYLRATFYRWAQQFPDICPELMTAPAVLSVGDLHIENFGTWRDREGRLIWGINDFDEASRLPYSNDLVRLAASVCFALTAGNLSLGRKDACEAIVNAYQEGLRKGGRPFVLAERNKALREMALNDLRDPAQFWQKLSSLTDFAGTILADAEEALLSILPETGLNCRFIERVAGVGSLGRPRYVALTEWRGGFVARECKAVAPSAAVWAAAAGSAEGEILYNAILNTAVRCPDPMIQVHGKWIVRRLAPDCSKIEFSGLATTKDIEKLLQAMGLETANVHLGTPGAAPTILQDLENRPADWLHKAAMKMVAATESDWQAWRLAV